MSEKQENFTFPLAQSVMLDWVSNEDGSHLLTVAVGNRVLLLTAVSSDISQASMKAMSEVQAGAGGAGGGPRGPLLRKSSSMAFNQVPDEIRWMQIRRVTLRTADGLNPTPMAVSWARDGVLMCAMDNEIAVYSQWREDSREALEAEQRQRRAEEREGQSSAADKASSSVGRKDIAEHRNLKEEDIITLATVG